MDAAICTAVEIIEEQEVRSKRPKVKITCWGETRKDFCKVRGFTTDPDSETEVAVTKKVRKRIKRSTGKASVKLKLNRRGKRLLRKAFERGEPLDVRVAVESRQAGKTSTFDYLVRLVSK
jgi:hypothetical protein